MNSPHPPIQKTTLKAALTPEEEKASYVAAAQYWERKCTALSESNRQLRDALEYYSNPSDYVAPFTGGLGKFYYDCGTKAKQTLAASDPEKVELI